MVLTVFLAAFTRSKRLSDQEIDELQRLINEHKEIAMEKLLQILKMSIMSCYVILFVIMAGCCLKAPKIFSYALWSVSYSDLSARFPLKASSALSRSCFYRNTTAKTVNGSPPIRPVIAGLRIVYPPFIEGIGSPAPFTTE